MKTLAKIAAVLLLTGHALAAEPSQSEKDALTVEQAIAIHSALSQLDRYQAVDKSGSSMMMPYKFSGETRYLIALNIEIGGHIKKQFNMANDGLVAQMSDGGTIVPEDKRPAFFLEIDKILKRQSGAGFYHFKKEDLKLDENPIPGSILNALLPIIDK